MKIVHVSSFFIAILAHNALLLVPAGAANVTTDLNQMDFQCHMDGKILYPVCPGKSSGQYCDGTGDCSTSFCGCDAGQYFCETDQNPCYGYYDDTPTGCDAYILSADYYLSTLNVPVAMECRAIPSGENHTYDPVEYYHNSCCSSTAYYEAENGQLGGFRFPHQSKAATTTNTNTNTNTNQNATNATDTTLPNGVCKAYAHAVSTMICDPRQGSYIQNDALRVCLSTCQTLYDACGPPGENFPSDSDYNDALGLCRLSWNGFGMEDTSSCLTNPGGYFCKRGLSLQIISDDTDCLRMIPPYDELLYWYETGQGRGEDRAKTICHEHEDGGAFPAFPWWAFPIFVVLGAGTLFLKWKYPKSEPMNGPFDQTTANGNQPVFDDNPNPTFPPASAYTATPTAPVEVPVEIPVAVPVDDQGKVKPASIFDQLSSDAGQGNAMEVEQPELSFLQKLDMRELEDQRRLGSIIDEEYELRKDAILKR